MYSRDSNYQGYPGESSSEFELGTVGFHQRNTDPDLGFSNFNTVILLPTLMMVSLLSLPYQG
jgi:hypothetical protein